MFDVRRKGLPISSRLQEHWRGLKILDSKKLEYRFAVIYAGVPSFFCFGVGGLSYSNFLASTVPWSQNIPDMAVSINSMHWGFFLWASS